MLDLSYFDLSVLINTIGQSVIFVIKKAAGDNATYILSGVLETIGLNASKVMRALSPVLGYAHCNSRSVESIFTVLTELSGKFILGRVVLGWNLGLVVSWSSGVVVP